jgi:uncharacterized membrane protein (DUF2068 family)
MADRPLLITIIAVLAILIGLLSIAGGAILIGANEAAGGIDVNTLHLLGYVGLIQGIIAVIVGVLLWMGWTIAWYLALIYFAISAIIDIANIALGNVVSVLSLLIAVILIWYLLRPNVKAFFKV